MYQTHFKNQKEVIIYSKNSKIDLCIDVLFIKRIRRDEKVLRRESITINELQERSSEINVACFSDCRCDDYRRSIN